MPCVPALLAAAAFAVPAPCPSVVQVRVNGPAQVRRLAGLGLDLGDTVHGGRVAAVLHSARDARRLRRAGLAFTPAPVARAAATTGVLPSGRTGYRRFADYDADLARLAAEHPGLVRRVTLPGASVQGRPIEGVEIAADVNRTDDGRPTHVELGLEHAREWSSGEVVMELGFDLVAGYGSDPRITRLVSGERTFLFPVGNPDGLVASQTVAPYQRKNAAGVDLNRNYGAFWGGPGASDSRLSETYRGPAPFSEPETSAVRAWSSAHQVMVLNSNHNFAGDVLYQPGFSRADEPGLPSGAALPGSERFVAVAERMAEAAGYRAGPAYSLYDATGATEDWNYFNQYTFGYTTEVGYDDFHPDYQDAVVDQYLGTVDGPLDAQVGREPSRGLREALLRAGEAALDSRNHAVIRGVAPPGRTLTLSKSFASSTAFVLTGTDSGAAAQGAAGRLPEHLASALTVPASGRYVWHVNPSTRPLEQLAGRTEAWTLECGPTRRSVEVGLGAVRTEDLACGDAPALRIASARRQGRAVVVRVAVRGGAVVRRVRATLGGSARRRARIRGRGRLVLRPKTRSARALRVTAITASGRTVAASRALGR